MSHLECIGCALQFGFQMHHSLIGLFLQLLNCLDENLILLRKVVDIGLEDG